MTFMDYAHVSPAWSAALADEFISRYRALVTGSFASSHRQAPVV